MAEEYLHEVDDVGLDERCIDPHLPSSGPGDSHRDLAEMKRRLAAHLHWYNHGRTSHALRGLLVPADRYFGRVEEVLARIEAGVTDEADPLDLRSRVLELFKVVSVDGRPEIWLMGQQILLTKK